MDNDTKLRLLSTVAGAGIGWTLGPHLVKALRKVAKKVIFLCGGKRSP